MNELEQLKRLCDALPSAQLRTTDPDAILEMVTPLGKKLGDCTGREVAALAMGAGRHERAWARLREHLDGLTPS